MRQCGECNLCCKLVPVVEGAIVNGKHIGGMNKPAGQRCRFQKHHKGCSIYDRRPMACRAWNCRWLVEDDTHDLHRPDRTHCVIDLMPDLIRITDDERGPVDIEVVQIWVDPTYPDAWRSPEMLAYIERRGSENIATIIRYDSKRAIVVFPPTISSDKQWHEIDDGKMVPQGELQATQALC